MGWAKYDEDIREKIDNRMRDSGRSYYGDTYINRPIDYPSRKTVGTSTVYSSTPSTDRPTTSTDTPAITYRTPVVSVPVTQTRVVESKPTPAKRKIGYIQREHEHNGIEIYFYSRPKESVLDELKDNGWHWHRQKKCWFRKHSASNQRLAEKIIEQ